MSIKQNYVQTSLLQLRLFLFFWCFVMCIAWLLKKIESIQLTRVACKSALCCIYIFVDLSSERNQKALKLISLPYDKINWKGFYSFCQ